jgi:hypothetical protein
VSLVNRSELARTRLSEAMARINALCEQQLTRTPLHREWLLRSELPKAEPVPSQSTRKISHATPANLIVCHRLLPYQVTALAAEWSIDLNTDDGWSAMERLSEWYV